MNAGCARTGTFEHELTEREASYICLRAQGKAKFEKKKLFFFLQFGKDVPLCIFATFVLFLKKIFFVAENQFLRKQVVK